MVALHNNTATALFVTLMIILVSDGLLFFLREFNSRPLGLPLQLLPMYVVLPRDIPRRWAGFSTDNRQINAVLAEIHHQCCNNIYLTN